MQRNKEQKYLIYKKSNLAKRSFALKKTNKNDKNDKNDKTTTTKKTTTKLKNLI
jgi:hypothetical protein